MITQEFLVLVPVVIGLIEVFKKAGLDIRYAPALSILIGVSGAYFLIGNDAVSLLNGVVVGLSASGLFSAYKTTTK